MKVGLKLRQGGAKTACRWGWGGDFCTPQSTYLIDRESNVYIYLDELKAAVESEYAYACDENGDQIVFSVQEARRFPVLSMEAALEQLSMI